jgi:hypothetical protein
MKNIRILVCMQQSQNAITLLHLNSAALARLASLSALCLRVLATARSVVNSLNLPAFATLSLFPWLNYRMTQQ